MIYLPEIIVEDAINTSFVEVLSNPANYVSLIFQHFSDERQANVLDWLQQTALGVEDGGLRVQQGFPSFPPRPGIYIVLAGATEQMQSVGNLMDVMEATAEHPRTLIYGAWFQTSVRVMIITPSADWTIYVQALVAWSLLSQRDEMAEAGLSQQQLSMQDLAPVREMQPDIVFSRDVILSCMTNNLWIKVHPEEITDVRTDFAGDDYP